MSAKDQHKSKLLDYLGNPSNDFLDRITLAKQVLGKSPRTLYKHFTPQELCDIEAEALAIRRMKFAPQLSKVDKKLLETAAETGNAAECKLCYQRFENWKETNKNELTGKDGGPIETETTHEISPQATELLSEIANNAKPRS